MNHQDMKYGGSGISHIMLIVLMPLVSLILIDVLHLQERQQQEEELKAKEAELIRGNPLLNSATSFNVKRRFVA